MHSEALTQQTGWPTILIGYGSFGKLALKRLLSGAALRGRLAWRPGDGGDGERRLRDLALLWLPDPDEAAHGVPREGSSALELMRDLDRQIRVVAPSDAETHLASVVSEVADRLLSATDRMRRSDPLPLGLDVVVLAQPERAEVIGRLDRLLVPALESLAARKVLGRGTQGAEKLSFLQIMDFEDYWRPGPQAQRIRDVLAASASRWYERSQAKKPAFGRIYLVDGQTEDGVKFGKDRLDEIVLFLEILLFEGLREHLQHLYQRQRDNEAPIATFGIRVFERSKGLLSRLAAARFAIDWLDHLDHAEPLPGSSSALDNLLAPLAGRGIENELAFGELFKILEEALRGLETDLVRVSPERPDWPAEIERGYRQAAGDLEKRLERELANLVASKESWLEQLPKRLAAAADTDLSALTEEKLERHSSPRSARVLLSSLDHWRHQLDPAAEWNQSSGDFVASLDFAPSETLHRRFREFREDQIRPEALRSFWPIWALAGAAGGSPLFFELLRALPAPDPNDAHHLVVKAFEILANANSPILAGVTLFVGFLSLGFFIAQPRLVLRAERGRRFFTDLQRGRFVDLLRRDLGPGGRLQNSLERHIGSAMSDRIAGVHGRLGRELDRLRFRLEERRREMSWLRTQLSELLRVHGLGADGWRADSEKLRVGSGVRYATERVGDVRRLLAKNPPGPERFRSMQSSERPLRGWRDVDMAPFLRPLDFLDDLSRRFRDPASPSLGAEAEELLMFLDRHQSFELSFPWHASDDVPVDRSYCLLPATRSLDPGVPQRLRELGMTDERWLEIPSPSRVYLLRIQTGVQPDRLTGKRER